MASSSTQFVAVALLVSCFVWFLNFSADRSTWRRVAVDQINTISGASATAGAANAQLDVAPGKLHVLVTGGAGFIGSHASLALLDAGHAVTVVDNLSRGNLGALRQVGASCDYTLMHEVHAYVDALHAMPVPVIDTCGYALQHAACHETKHACRCVMDPLRIHWCSPTLLATRASAPCAALRASLHPLPIRGSAMLTWTWRAGLMCCMARAVIKAMSARQNCL